MESAFGLPPPTDDAVPPPPRRVSRTARRVLLGLGHGHDVLLFVGLGFLGIGSILATVFCWGLPTDVAIDVAGRETDAELVSSNVDTSMTVNGAHPTTVRFRYLVDGVPHEDATNTFDTEHLLAASEGRPLRVEYLPAHPQWARLKGESRALFGYFGSFTLLFPSIGALLLLSVVASVLRRRAVYRRGRAVAGRFSGSNASLGGRGPGYLSWEYAVDGRTYRNGMWSKHFDEAGVDVSNGAPATILYLPGRPGEGLPYLPGPAGGP